MRLTNSIARGTAFAIAPGTPAQTTRSPSADARRGNAFASRIAISMERGMKGWVRFRRGRACYTGAIARLPFVAWLATPEGRAVLDGAVARTRFAVLTERRAARRLWRQLAAAAREPAAVVVIQSEADAYLDRLRDFTCAAGLPRLSVDLHRLVVVPRVLVNGAAYGGIARRLLAERAFAALEG
ncbi:MAG: hypothetical protein DMF93_22105, partial [Acidobacteria bacterium]